MKKRREEFEKQPIRYWLVDLTLTSGEKLQFYVSAINQIEAYRKADMYSELAEIKQLQKFYDGFKLLPSIC